MISNTKKRALFVADRLTDLAGRIKRETERNDCAEDLARFIVHEILWAIPNIDMDMLFQDVQRDLKNEK